VSEAKIAYPLRSLLKNVSNLELVLAEMTGIDAAGRRVLARRQLGQPIEFGYDYLILAAGVRQSYFGHDEFAVFAPGMKTIEDARRVRQPVLGAFEMAESLWDGNKVWLIVAGAAMFAASSPYSRKAMTVVVVIFLPLVLACQAWTYTRSAERIGKEKN
jgi:NADH dehydrogenase FAD-containing subunit